MRLVQHSQHGAPNEGHGGEWGCACGRHPPPCKRRVANGYGFLLRPSARAPCLKSGRLEHQEQVCGILRAVCGVEYSPALPKPGFPGLALPIQPRRLLFCRGESDRLLGLDHQQLAVTQGARQIRLTSAEGGKVVREILA